jgi:hypothetical protein
VDDVWCFVVESVHLRLQENAEVSRLRSFHRLNNVKLDLFTCTKIFVNGFANCRGVDEHILAVVRPDKSESDKNLVFARPQVLSAARVRENWFPGSTSMAQPY